MNGFASGMGVGVASESRAPSPHSSFAIQTLSLNFLIGKLLLIPILLNSCGRSWEICFVYSAAKFSKHFTQFY